jgi:nucleoside-diphosphate-sugar epimerase
MKQRIFLTGASGYIGSAVAARLVRSGHEVFGLTRTRPHARVIEALGAKSVIADMANIADYLGVLQNCDIAIHAAADHEKGAAEQDLHALEAFRQAALDGRVRRVIYTSGIWVHGPGTAAIDESAALKPLDIVSWRPAHEQIAIDLSAHEVATVVLRPGVVYGEGRGILGGWWAEAHEQKTLTYPGDGAQQWPMVHREDLADAYALALEHGKAGEAYLVADGSQHTVKQMADAAAAASGATAKSWAADDLVKTLGAYGKALLNNQTVNAGKAHRELGWVPRHTSFVDEAPQLWREWLGTREAPVA